MTEALWMIVGLLAFCAAFLWEIIRLLRRAVGELGAIWTELNDRLPPRR